MCRILTSDDCPTILDVRAAHAAAPDGIGAALFRRGRVEILRHLSLSDAEAIAEHCRGYVLHFRRGGSRSRGPEWCQPYRCADGRAVCAVGSRAAMRRALGLPDDYDRSPVAMLATWWDGSHTVRRRLARAGVRTVVVYPDGLSDSLNMGWHGPVDSSLPLASR